MPTYTYACTSCNDVIEKRQSFSDAPLTTCEQCGGTLRKVIHPVGIVFKGSGWYVNDSRSANSAATPGSSNSGEKSGDGKSGDGKSEGGKSEGGKSDGGKSDGAPASSPSTSGNSAPPASTSNNGSSSSTPPASKPAKTSE